MSGAKIFWEDSLIATADNNGEFRIELTEKIKVIEIGSVGMYSDRIELTGSCDYLEVILLPDVIYDFASVEKEERLRKKDRAILPELYKVAFDQGIFRKEEPCR